jgi:hypothetical protein
MGFPYNFNSSKLGININNLNESSKLHLNYQSLKIVRIVEGKILNYEANVDRGHIGGGLIIC